MALIYIRLALFMSPFVIVWLLLGLALERAGELESIDNVVRAQLQKPVIYGLAYSENTWQYKMRAMQLRHPAVVVLGSSRVMQCRAEFFRRQEGFYNCGIGDFEMPDLSTFLDTARINPEMRVIILGLDPWTFNPKYNSSTQVGTGKENESSKKQTYLIAWRPLLADWCTGKVRIYASLAEGRGETNGVSYVGFLALTAGEGFRNDGSRRSRETPNDKAGFQNTIARIRTGHPTDRFSHASSISEKHLAELESFLGRCRTLGIHVIGFEPPFAPSVHQEIVSPAGLGYLHVLHSSLRTLFNQAGFPFFDYSDAGALGANDDEFLDGFHGSEVCDLRVLAAMSRVDVVLSQYCDHRRLDALLKGRRSGLELDL